MRSFAYAAIFAATVGLVILAVESYGLSPNWLILWAIVGAIILIAAIVRSDY